MRKFVLFATVLFCICSCNNSNKKGRAEIRPQFQYTFIDVILDTTSTWTQILDAANTFTDSLSIIAADENIRLYLLACNYSNYEVFRDETPVTRIV